MVLFGQYGLERRRFVRERRAQRADRLTALYEEVSLAFVLAHQELRRVGDSSGVDSSLLRAYTALERRALSRMLE